MELYVIRHGIAEERDPNVDDAQRQLTDKGRQRTHQAAVGMARVLSRPSVILSSPKLRAQQTATIVGEVFDTQVQILDDLASESPDRIFAELHRRSESRLAIVGHEPTLSELIEMLCTKGTAHGFIEMKKAGCIVLDAPIDQSPRPGNGKLISSLTPRMLRALASDS